MLSITIDGRPIPWKRAGERHVNGKVIHYDRQAVEKEQVRWQLRDQFRQEILTVPILIDIIFYRQVPKSASKKMREQMLHDYVKCAVRPDMDNCEKFLMDAMTGVIYKDDALIYDKHTVNRWSLRPATVIRIVPYTTTDVVPPSDIGDEPFDDDDQYI